MSIAQTQLRVDRQRSRVRVRASAATWFAAGLVLTIIAAVCATSAVRVDHPIALVFMYAWFAGLSFFAAWVSQTQESPPS